MQDDRDAAAIRKKLKDIAAQYRTCKHEKTQFQKVTKHRVEISWPRPVTFDDVMLFCKKASRTCANLSP